MLGWASCFSHPIVGQHHWGWPFEGCSANPQDAPLFFFKPICALCFYLYSKARTIRLNVWTVTSSKFLNVVQMTTHAQMHHLCDVLLRVHWPIGVGGKSRQRSSAKTWSTIMYECLWKRNEPACLHCKLGINFPVQRRGRGLAWQAPEATHLGLVLACP